MSRWQRLHQLAVDRETECARDVGRAMTAERDIQADLDRHEAERQRAGAAVDPQLHEQFLRFWQYAEWSIQRCRKTLVEASALVFDGRR